MKFEKILNWMFYISFGIFFLSLPLSYGGQSVGIALGLIAWICSVIYRKKFFSQPITKVGIFVIIFIFSGLVATVISGINLNSLDGFRKILGCILFFFLVSQGIKDELQIKKIFLILIIASSIAALYGIVQYFTGLNLAGIERVKVFDRVQGTLSANSLGGLLGMVLPIAFSVAIFYRNALIWSCVIFITICLGFTFTRGAWIGGISGIGIIIFIYNKKFLLPFFVILVSLFLLWPQGRERIVNTFRRDKELARRNMWIVAIEMVKERPVFGWGPQSFAKTFDSSELAIEKGHSHPHNIYLGLAAETGFFGLICFLTLAGYALYLCFRLITTEVNFSRFLVLGLTGSIVDFLVHGFVDYTLYGETGFIFGFILGIIDFIQQSHFKDTPYKVKQVAV